MRQHFFEAGLEDLFRLFFTFFFFCRLLWVTDIACPQIVSSLNIYLVPTPVLNLCFTCLPLLFWVWYVWYTHNQRAGGSQAILTLPDPEEWGDSPAAAVADRHASYHQTLEFPPAAAPASHASRRGGGAGAIFCAVSVARRRRAAAARRVGTAAGGSVGSVGGGSGGGGGGGRRARKAGKVTVVSFAPTMSLKNLLAAPADVRLSCPSSLQRARQGGGGGSGGSARAGNAGGVGNGDQDSSSSGGGGVWCDAIERGTEVSWLRCPPDEEVQFFFFLNFELVRAVVFEAFR